MTPQRRRTVRRFFRSARGPVLYAAILVVSLTAFLTSMRSCSREPQPAADTQVQIIVPR